MMTITAGPFRCSGPEEAVAATFRGDGIRPEHVEIEAIDPEIGTWRWQFREGAPVVLDKGIIRFTLVEVRGRIVPINPHHPVIARGVAVDTDYGLVVATGDESEDDQLLAACQHALDLERMHDGNADRAVPEAPDEGSQGQGGVR